MHAKVPFLLRRWMAISVAVAGLACVPQAHATLINVDFNTAASATYSGAAVLGSAGDTWNGIHVSNMPLVDSTGASTGVTLSVAGTSGAYDATYTGCLMASSTFASLMCDYIYRVNDGTNATVTLTGLAQGAAFDLVLYSSANVVGRQTDFTLDGLTNTVTAGTGTNFVAGTNYTEFTGTVAATGVLSFTFTGPIEGNLDGIQLTQTPNGKVPEPATLALFGLGLAAVGYKRRKR